MSNKINNTFAAIAHAMDKDPNLIDQYMAGKPVGKNLSIADRENITDVYDSLRMPHLEGEEARQIQQILDAEPVMN